jgi:hypothetical protein
VIVILVTIRKLQNQGIRITFEKLGVNKRLVAYEGGEIVNTSIVKYANDPGGWIRDPLHYMTFLRCHNFCTALSQQQ